MCIVCDFLEFISLLVLALRPHRVANKYDCICSGVWSPELKHKSLDLGNISRKAEKKSPPSELPPIWTPNASPTPERKTYKPIKFESPTLSRKKLNLDTKKVLHFIIIKQLLNALTFNKTLNYRNLQNLQQIYQY